VIPLSLIGAASAQPVSKTGDADQTGASQASRKHGLGAQAQPAGHKPIQGKSRDDAAEEAQGLHSDFFDHSLLPEYVSRLGFSHLTLLEPDAHRGASPRKGVSIPFYTYLYPIIY
jgi:hypothetical protein